MSLSNISRFAYLLAPLLLTSAACEGEEVPEPAKPLPAVGRVAGENIVRVLPGQKDSLFTVHAEQDGLWLQESSLVGEARFRTRIADDADENIAVVPHAHEGVMVASHEDGFIAVRHIDVGGTWTVGTLIVDPLLQPATRIVGVVGPSDDVADLYLEQGGDLYRVRFPFASASSEPSILLGLETEALSFVEVVGLAGDRVAAISPGGGSAELRVFGGESEGAYEGLTPGVGSVARVIGNDGANVWVRVDTENGDLAVHRAGRDGHAVYGSPLAVAIDADANGVSDVWLAEDGYSLVESGPIGAPGATKSYWLGSESDLRVDDVVILPAGYRAVLGQRYGVEGVVVYAPAVATE